MKLLWIIPGIPSNFFKKTPHSLILNEITFDLKPNLKVASYRIISLTLTFL